MTCLWYLIRTATKREQRVYSALVEMGYEAWLPQEPRFTRLSPHTKHRRQWWGPILPGRFFAAVPPADFRRFADLRDFNGVESDGSGLWLAMGEASVADFRRQIERENREIVRLASGGQKTAEASLPKPKPKPKNSRRIKKGRHAKRLKNWHRDQLGRHDPLPMGDAA